MFQSSENNLINRAFVQSAHFTPMNADTKQPARLMVKMHNGDVHTMHEKDAESAWKALQPKGAKR